MDIILLCFIGLHNRHCGCTQKALLVLWGYRFSLAASNFVSCCSFLFDFILYLIIHIHVPLGPPNHPRPYSTLMAQMSSAPFLILHWCRLLAFKWPNNQAIESNYTRAYNVCMVTINKADLQNRQNNSHLYSEVSYSCCQYFDKMEFIHSSEEIN